MRAIEGTVRDEAIPNEGMGRPMDSEMCPNGCDLRGPLIPETIRDNYTPGSIYYSRKIGVEIRGVYDGTLFYTCPDCGIAWQRWQAGSHRAAQAQPWIDDQNERCYVTVRIP